MKNKKDLLVVICGQGSINETLLNKQSEAENALKEANASQQLYEEQMEIADQVNQYVWAVSVVVPYDEKDVTQRQIMILKEGEEIESFALVGNDVKSAKEAFKNSLLRFVKEHEDKPVILSLNEGDDDILYRDEVMVNELFLELSKEYHNVYIKGIVSEDAE